MSTIWTVAVYDSTLFFGDYCLLDLSRSPRQGFTYGAHEHFKLDRHEDPPSILGLDTMFWNDCVLYSQISTAVKTHLISCF